MSGDKSVATIMHVRKCEQRMFRMRIEDQSSSSDYTELAKEFRLNTGLDNSPQDPFQSRQLVPKETHTIYHLFAP